MTALIILFAIIVYYTIGKRWQSLILVALSLYIYWLAAEWNVFIISGIIAIVLSANAMMQKKRSRLLVTIPIVIIFAAFILFREQFTGIALPLGYSVLSFTAISLLIDQYRTPQKYQFVDIANYLLFFPKIFAGPIERANYFIDRKKKSFNLSNIYSGFKYLIFASFLKFVVGDMIATPDTSGCGVNATCGIFIYAIGFFFDFWAYSLMAIGVGRIFGYNLSASFDLPYYSASFKEFWHRWNITLGTWLRDYIYIPLGGNKNSSTKWSLVILTVFLVSGLWHGSTLPFIIWGIAHGGLMCLEGFLIKPYRLHRLFKVLYSIVVFIIVSFLWQLFDVSSMSEFTSRCSQLCIPERLELQVSVRLVLCFLLLMFFSSKRVISLITTNSTEKKAIVYEVSMLTIMLTILVVLHCPISFNFFYFKF